MNDPKDLLDEASPTTRITVYPTGTPMMRIDLPRPLEKASFFEMLEMMLPETVHFGFRAYVEFLENIRGDPPTPISDEEVAPPPTPDGKEPKPSVVLMLVLKDIPQKGLTTSIPVWSVWGKPDDCYFMVEKRSVN